jgi:hypothetical protein
VLSDNLLQAQNFAPFVEAILVNKSIVRLDLKDKWVLQSVFFAVCVCVCVCVCACYVCISLCRFFCDIRLSVCVFPPQCPRFSFLSLSLSPPLLDRSEVGDEGAKLLCDGLIKDPELEALQIENNGLTEEGTSHVLRLMGKHGSLSVASSVDGSSILLQTKYQVVKLQLLLAPILALLEFVSEPTQLLSCAYFESLLLCRLACLAVL